MSGFSRVKTDATDDFFRAFKADAKVDADAYSVITFGKSLKLVLDGITRSRHTLACVLAEENIPLPKVGDYCVVVEPDNRPRCVIRTTNVTVKPLLAFFEPLPFQAEADETLETWRRRGREHFVRQAESKGFQYSDEMETVWEEFVVVWPRLFADDWKGPRLQ